MEFYDLISDKIKITHNSDDYLKVIDNILYVPSKNYLQLHIRYADTVMEAIHAFNCGLFPHSEYDINKIDKKVIKDASEACIFLNKLQNNYKIFSIDIETSNLLPDSNKNKLLCIGIAYDNKKAVSFTRECFNNKIFRLLFQKFILSSDLTFILHNGIFDRSRLKIIENIDLKIDEDTLLMHYCGINEHKGTHGLKDLAQLYLKFPEWEQVLDDYKKEYCKQNKIKQKDFQYDFFPQEMLAEYCCIDVCATYQLYNVFKQLMNTKSVQIYQKLVEASKYYADMISRGMLLDNAYWIKLRDELEDEKTKLEKDFEILMPGVNVSSPLQLKNWLQKAFIKEKITSTDKNSIETLLLKYPNNAALQKILEYRKNIKYLKTYVYGLWERKDSSDVIHCEFKLHGTETGRLSSANPNMQNIPRNSSIKSLFISRPGYTLLQLDYSQAELRVLAHISNDDKLIECYVEGRDLHTEMAKQLFGNKYDPHNKDQRVIAKTINFGIPYGRTARGMSQNLQISLSKAQEYLDNWFKGAPKVRDYINKCHQDATSVPQKIYYTVFGRSRHYLITEENIKHVENQAVNFPISSTANDLTIYSLCEIGKYIEKEKFDAYLVNTVHDSIIIEVRPRDAKEIALKCQQIMSETPKKYLIDAKVPFKADAELGNCYGDLSEPDWYEDEEDDE